MYKPIHILCDLIHFGKYRSLFCTLFIGTIQLLSLNPLTHKSTFLLPLYKQIEYKSNW